jgi:hypothetical protein
MPEHKVTVFRPYPFEVGQKIRIEGGPRSGDWEVVGLTERKIKLRCPLSGREFEWARFCCFAEDRENEPWPKED